MKSLNDLVEEIRFRRDCGTIDKQTESVLLEYTNEISQEVLKEERKAVDSAVKTAVSLINPNLVKGHCKDCVYYNKKIERCFHDRGRKGNCLWRVLPYDYCSKFIEREKNEHKK